MNIVESFVGGGGLRATGEPRRRAVILYVCPSVFLRFSRHYGPKRWGWGERREQCARARGAANLARNPGTARPPRARAHSSLFNPSPISSVRTPARARLSRAHARCLLYGFPAYGSGGCERCHLGLPLVGWDRRLSSRPLGL